MPGSGHLVCGGSLVRPSKSWRGLLNQGNQYHWLIHGEGGGSCSSIIKHCTFSSFASLWLVEGIASLPPWTLWASTGTVDTGGLWVQTERQQLSSLCQDSSSANSTPWSCEIIMDKRESYMKGPWITWCFCCWVLNTIGSCQSAAHFSSGSDFSGVCVYVNLKLLCLDCVSVPSLLQCSSTCGKGLQSRVVQCMHKVTGRHGNECPVLSKPAAYRQCHQEVCNEKINVNTITSPRLGEWGVLGGKMPTVKDQTKPRVPVW